MRLLHLAVFCLAATFAFAQNPNLKIVTWNIRDMGRTKSTEEIDQMAQILRGYDVIAVQEVVAKDPAGARAIAKLTDALDRTGADYDYRVSDPTRSSSPHIRERYAYIWRTSTVKLVTRPTLLSAFAKTVEREPYLIEFSWRGKPFRVVNFHARPHDQQPEQELAKFRSLLRDYADQPLFFLGDLNVVSHHTVFAPWVKRGYQLAMTGEPTTIRRKSPEDGTSWYAHEGDNIVYPGQRVELLERGLLDVVAYLGHDLDAVYALSDHAPVYVVVGRME